MDERAPLGLLRALCATLPGDELTRDRGAFFKSIHGTLNHIAYADLAFFSRFTGIPAEVLELGVDVCADFAELRGTREALDLRPRDWTATLVPEWLRDTLTYTSKVDGRRRTVPRWVLVVHLFKQQTHHRGEATALLWQMGPDMGSTDLPFMPSY
jgi:uncharacterized damage-inducible protein DinB